MESAQLYAGSGGENLRAKRYRGVCVGELGADQITASKGVKKYLKFADNADFADRGGRGKKTQNLVDVLYVKAPKQACMPRVTTDEEKGEDGHLAVAHGR